MTDIYKKTILSIHLPHKITSRKLSHKSLNCFYYVYCYPTFVLFCGDASHMLCFTRCLFNLAGTNRKYSGFCF